MPAGARVAEEPDEVLPDERRTRLVKRWLAAAVLYPLLTVTMLSLVEFAHRVVTRTGFWRSEALVFFGLGGVLWAVFWLSGLRLVRVYVFGHELSHLVVAKLFGGRILGFSVSSSGGYVDTDKSNTWITLAPYLLPIYSAAVLLLFLVLGCVVDLQQRLPLGGGYGLRPVLLFYLLLGLTWWFHATYTVRSLRVAQTDLKRNGEFFSLSIIVLGNLTLLLGMYLSSSPQPWYELKQWVRVWWSNALWLLSLLGLG
jgi:hypothetical protein